MGEYRLACVPQVCGHRCVRGLHSWRCGWHAYILERMLESRQAHPKEESLDSAEHRVHHPSELGQLLAESLDLPIALGLTRRRTTAARDGAGGPSRATCLVSLVLLIVYSVVDDGVTVAVASEHHRRHLRGRLRREPLDLLAHFVLRLAQSCLPCRGRQVESSRVESSRVESSRVEASRVESQKCSRECQSNTASDGVRREGEQEGRAREGGKQEGRAKVSGLTHPAINKLAEMDSPKP